MHSPRVFLLATVIFLTSVSAAVASYTASATSSTPSYLAGAANTFTFQVGVQSNGTYEYVDQIKITFPAGWAITGATGPSGSGSCGGNAGVQSIASNVVSWSTVGTMPTGCGPFKGGTFDIAVTVDVPGGTTGTQTAVVKTTGDGYPIGVPSVQNFNIDFLAPHLTLTKDAVPTTYHAVGDVIGYTLVATNDGGVELDGVTIGDPLLPSLACVPTQPVTLAAGAALTCTASYAVTQGDLNAGAVHNTASASGTIPGSIAVAALDASATATYVPPIDLLQPGALTLLAAVLGLLAALALRARGQ
jgi:uncharacterized repeat protein (TIGR01451 family)